mgnify:CR=1 FL=1
MSKTVNLLEGRILPALVRLAVPITATALIQMAYNLTDMIWIGRLGSNQVAAVGAAGMYSWLAAGLATMCRMGGQVKTAQSLGAGNPSDAARYAKTALILGLLAGIIFGGAAGLLHRPLIGFFHLNSPQVIADAEIYMIITCGGVVFNYINQIMTGLLTASGNSTAPFLATTVGLVSNIALDPLLIFGLGPIPALGVMGAAIATVFAQLVVMVIMIYFASRDTVLFVFIRWREKLRGQDILQVVKIGLPTAVQSMIFSAISMVVARLIAGWGDAAVAVQKVGSQIESISWMTADGFSASINAFIGQNYGAGNKERVRKGFYTSSVIVVIWGIFTTLMLTVFPEPLFRIFITEADVIPMGVEYLRILGYSQLFMCLEIATEGAFAGLGKTLPPSIVSILFTSIRIPMVMLLGSKWGLSGVWWSLTISSILKGVILIVWFIIYLKKKLGTTSFQN